MNSWPKAALSLLILPTLLLVPGCWDNRDFSKLLFVSAMGIDKTRDNRIELTLEVIKPNATSSAQGGQGNSPNSVWVESFSGDTVMDAVRNALSTANRQPNYSQTLILVIGENLAKEGILQSLDLCARDHEIRKKIHVLVAKGTTAKNILNVKSSLEPIPAMYVSEVLENEAANPKLRKVELFDVLKDIGSPGINPTLGLIELPDPRDKNKDLHVTGAAAFRRDKLVGYLNENQTMGLLFVLNELKGGVLNVPNPFDTSKKLTMEIKSSKTDIDVTQDNGQLILEVKVDTEGNIADAEGTTGTLDEKTVGIIEQEAAAKITEIIKSTVTYAQQDLKSDIFGFGKCLWENNPRAWDSLKDHWNEDFNQAQLVIEVKTKAKSPGLVIKSVEPK